MPSGSCEYEKQRMAEAESALNQAEMAVSSADSNLSAAEWALAAAIAAMAACAFTVETVIGFVFCEAAATAAAESAESWVESAQQGLEIAQSQEAHAVVEFLDAVDALSRCCEANAPHE